MPLFPRRVLPPLVAVLVPPGGPIGDPGRRRRPEPFCSQGAESGRW